MSDQLSAWTATYTTTQETRIHTFGGIEIRDPSNQATSDCMATSIGIKTYK